MSRVLALACLCASAAAFAPVAVPSRSRAMKAARRVAPVAAVRVAPASPPARRRRRRRTDVGLLPIARSPAPTHAAQVPELVSSLDLATQALPSQLLSLEVTAEAYMAVILGTFLPSLFLISLYTQSEAQREDDSDYFY